MKRKKFILVLLILAILSALLIGCSKVNKSTTVVSSNKEINASSNGERNITDNKKQQGEFNIDAHMGKWYYSPYSDYVPESYLPMYIKKTGINTASVLYDDEEFAKITFVSDNMAKSDKYADVNNEQCIMIFNFMADSDGEKFIVISPTFADTGEPSAEGACAYRKIP